MTTKTKSTNSRSNTNKNVNTNNNVNNNTIHNNVFIDRESVNVSAKKSNWFMKAVIGGIITIAVSLAIYYGKYSIDGQNNTNSTEQNQEPVIGTKQTK